MIYAIREKMNDPSWVNLYGSCYSILNYGSDGYPLKEPLVILKQDLSDFLGVEPTLRHYSISKQFARDKWLDHDITDLVIVKVPENLREEFVSTFGEYRQIWFRD